LKYIQESCAIAKISALLLLRAGVESNPGPAAGESKTKSSNIGLLN